MTYSFCSYECRSAGTIDVWEARSMPVPACSLLRPLPLIKSPSKKLGTVVPLPLTNHHTPPPPFAFARLEKVHQYPYPLVPTPPNA